ncbi:MAG TPA: hypothetical protein VK037_03825 [Pseudogracilibacillus sp.]|nr:hypothetical protein [Pseudogracilibacillus sp.]
MNYSIKEITLQRGERRKKRKVIQFDDPNLTLLEEFLMVDAPLRNWQILNEFEQIKRVKQGTITYTGNRTTVTVTPTNTTIEDALDVFNGENTVEIETDQLYKLLKTWQKEIE